ncbi:MAG: MFS transporter [Candidatus Bathyarchaeia archaeon]
MRSATFTLFLVTLSTFLTFVCIGVYAVTFATFATSLEISPAMVGAIIGTSGLVRIFLDMPVGVLVDRVGRKIPGLIGTMLFSVAALVCALARDVYYLVAFQVLQGLSQMFYMAATIVLVSDLSPSSKAGRYMSLWQTGLVLGQSIGPVVGGGLADLYNERAAFWFSFIVSIAPITIYLVSVPRRTELTEVTKAPKTGQGTAVLGVLKDKRILGGCFAAFASFFTVIGIRTTLLPIYGTRLGLDKTSVGVLVGISGAVNTILLLPSGVLSDRLGRRLMLTAGLSLFSVSVVGYILSKSFLTLVVPSVLFGVASAIVGPSRIVAVTDYAKPGEKGTAMGAYRTFQSLALVLGPMVAGALLELYSPEAAFASSIVICMVAVALIRMVLRR